MSESTRRLMRLLESLARTAQDEWDCERVDELLETYAEAVAAGQDVALLLPQVRQHLERCPDCLEELDCLVRMLRAGQA